MKASKLTTLAFHLYDLQHNNNYKYDATNRRKRRSAASSHHGYSSSDIIRFQMAPLDDRDSTDSMDESLNSSMHVARLTPLVDNSLTISTAKTTVEKRAADSAVSQLERTQKQLERLRQQQEHLNGNRVLSEINADDDVTASANTTSSSESKSRSKMDCIEMERNRIYESYIKLPASDLKNQCVQRQINEKGRKPDLAQRLAEDDIISTYGLIQNGKAGLDDINAVGNGSMLISGMAATNGSIPSKTTNMLTKFAGLYPLSKAAQSALTLAQFVQPTIIQSRAIPILSSGRSAIIHAATGSGKTLAYILPFTERLWHEQQQQHFKSNDGNNDKQKVAFILTPSRELAAQVAGITSILAPPGTVRFVTRPCNLLSRMKQERTDGTEMIDTTTRIYVGSAKVIYQSLYGDGRMPASPTTKPEAMFLLQNTAYLVLDEVDRLLGVVGGVNSNNYGSSSYGKRSKSTDDSSNVRNVNTHEKPAAILTAAIARLALGKATTVAASATVGRPLRRELARCMGLTPQECPIIVRDSDIDDDTDVDIKSEKRDVIKKTQPSSTISGTVSRAVTVPSTVSHYIIPVVDGTSPGKILTTAFAAIQSLGPHRRMLLVLTRNFGITTQNAIGALKHFKCQPEPISLLDALETTDGTEAMMEIHRQVTGVSGVGSSHPSSSVQQQQRGYLLVTGEDTVRGLHLDGLDVVLVASRSVGPDEYTHIAGRTGRAGRSGNVVNIVNDADVNKVTGWEKMLNITFISCPTAKEIGSMLGSNSTK